MHLNEEPTHREEPIGSIMPLPPTREPRPKRTRGRRVEANKSIRPSTLQDFCKKFDGSGDPYDHIAQYRQLLFATGIINVHTMVQTFGLTIEGQALAWF